MCLGMDTIVDNHRNKILTGFMMIQVHNLKI